MILHKIDEAAHVVMELMLPSLVWGVGGLDKAFKNPTGWFLRSDEVVMDVVGAP